MGARAALNLKLSPEQLAYELISIMSADAGDVEILSTLALFLKDAGKGNRRRNRPLSRLVDISAELSIAVSCKSYLDIGCSEGRITAAVAGALNLSKFEAHACDILELKRPNKAFSFLRCSETSLPYQDESFDFITMFMSAHHFTNVHAMFSETRRISRPGAYLLMREHGTKDRCYYDIIHAIYACTNLCSHQVEYTPEEFVHQYRKNKVYAHYRTVSEWTKIAIKHGFTPAIKPHWPVSQQNGTHTKDRMFDAVYMMFQRT